MYTLGIGFMAGAGAAVFVESAQLREILMAAASVFAVFIAALSIDETRRLRKESADKASKGRKERLLNEIIEWAISVVEAAFYRQTKDPHEIWSALSKYRYLEARSKYIEVVVKSNFVELYKCLQAISTELGNLKEFTEKCANDEADKDKLKDYEQNLETSVENFFREAAKIKSELLK